MFYLDFTCCFVSQYIINTSIHLWKILTRSKTTNSSLRTEKISTLIYKERSLHPIFDNFKPNYLSDHSLISTVRHCGVGCASPEERVRVDHYKDRTTKGVPEHCLLYGDQETHCCRKQDGRNFTSIFSGQKSTKNLDLRNRFLCVSFVCVLFKLRKLTNHKHYIKINLRQTVHTLFARVSNRSKLLATRFNCQDLFSFPLKPSTEQCKNPLKWTILSQEQYSNENHCQFLLHKANFRLPHLQIMDCLYLSRHLTSFELVFQISIIV